VTNATTGLSIASTMVSGRHRRTRPEASGSRRKNVEHEPVDANLGATARMTASGSPVRIGCGRVREYAVGARDDRDCALGDQAPDQLGPLPRRQSGFRATSIGRVPWPRLDLRGPDHPRPSVRGGLPRLPDVGPGRRALPQLVGLTDGLAHRNGGTHRQPSGHWVASDRNGPGIGDSRVAQCPPRAPDNAVCSSGRRCRCVCSFRRDRSSARIEPLVRFTSVAIDETTRPHRVIDRSIVELVTPQL